MRSQSLRTSLRRVSRLAMLLLLASCDSTTGVTSSQALTLRVGVAYGGTPDTHAMRLTLEPTDAAHGTATLTAPGSSTVVEYLIDRAHIILPFDGVSLALDAPQSCPPTLSIESLTLDATIAHGQVVTVHGVGEGAYTDARSSDAPWAQTAVITIDGTQDTGGVSIVAASTVDVHPLDLTSVALDGPASATELDLLDTSGTQVDTFEGRTNTPSFGVAYESFDRGGVPLSWGATYTIEAPTSAPTDTIGRPLAALSIRTVAAPSPFVTPGFEGDVQALLGPGAGIVSPAIEGASALGIDRGGSATFVFAQGPATTLAVRFRSLNSPAPPGTLSVDFFDGSSLEHVVLSAAPGFDWSNDAIAAVQAPLPDFAIDGSFAVRIVNPGSLSCGTLPSAAADVVIETLSLL